MSCLKKRFFIISLSIIIGFIALLLFNNQSVYINQLYFIFTAIIGLVSLVSILISDALTIKNNYSYNCCGTLATIGSNGLIFMSILAITLQIYAYTTIINIVLALIFFFLTLLLGGLWGYLKLHHHPNYHY